MTRARFLDMLVGLALGGFAAGAFSAWTVERELAELGSELRTEVKALRRDVDRLLSRP